MVLQPKEVRAKGRQTFDELLCEYNIHPKSDSSMNPHLYRPGKEGYLKHPVGTARSSKTDLAFEQPIRVSAKEN